VLSYWIPASHIHRPWIWRRHVPLKHRLTFNGLLSVISQKTELIFSMLLVQMKPVWGSIILD
jgi:hypothetical protein